MPIPAVSALTGVRDVMVALTEEGRGDEVASALGYGLTLAREAGAHLTVQSASIRFVTTGLVLGSFIDKLIGAENRRMASLARNTAERIAQDAARAGVVCTTESPSLQYDRLVARLATQARLHDLTILDAEPLAVLPDRDLIEGLLFASGRPLIVVPPGRDAFQARRIIVAWDGSAQAARAANDALPFLRAAEAVALVCVDEAAYLQDRVPGAEFAPHLARHGVAVTVENRPAGGDAAEALRRSAAGFRADLIVMGAFRHSRLREWVLGGVTQSLLARCELPLFMTH